MAELDELEAECQMEGLCDMPVAAPVALAGAAAPAKKMSAEEEELMRMMDIDYTPAPAPKAPAPKAPASKPAQMSKATKQSNDSSINRSKMAIQEALAKASASKSAAPREESKQSAPLNKATPKPAFNDFIKMQASSGYWETYSRNTLALCIEGGSTVDDAVLQALRELGLQDAEGDLLEKIYLTLLALYLLEEAYADEQDQWQMIARKAKTYLEQTGGISKPN